MFVLTHAFCVWVLVCWLCSAYADPGALNRAEWVKFVAIFFNKEVEANKLFSTITTTYKQLNTSARAAAAAAGGPAKVAWINKFGDSLTLSYAVYKQELVTVSCYTAC
jgi:iron complex transport system substrate-binding protein